MFFFKTKQTPKPSALVDEKTGQIDWKFNWSGRVPGTCLTQGLSI